MVPKNVVFAIALLAAGATIGLAVWLSPPVDPTHAFVVHAGHGLPNGVSVVAYREIIADNFFHTTRYWLLTGSPDSMRQLAKGPDFASSLDDAQFALPNMADLFSKPWQSADVIAGFEQNQGRGRWIWVFSGEREALYALN